MNTIDILVAVDGAKLAQQVADGSINPGSQSSPTVLGAYADSDVYISMISESSNVTNEQGQSELTVSANSGDTLRWSMTTFGNNADQTAYLYAGNFNPSDAISELSYVRFEENLYLPPSGDPTGTPVKLLNNVLVASGIIQRVSVQIQYTLSFTLVDNATGSIIGYFTWDPFIQVN